MFGIKTKKQKIIGAYQDLDHLLDDILKYIRDNIDSTEDDLKNDAMINRTFFYGKKSAIISYISVLKALPSDNIEWLHDCLREVTSGGMGSLSDIYFGPFYGNKAHYFQQEISNKTNRIFKLLN